MRRPSVVEPSGRLRESDGRYVRWRSHHSTGPVSWLGLVLAPRRTTAVVVAAGLLVVAGSVTVTLTISRVGEAAHRFPWELVVTLTLGFAAETVGFWVKERHELLLTAQVRQLIFRRFMRLSSKAAGNRSSLREQVLTYPTQISQFAYVVDFAVSSVQVDCTLQADVGDNPS